MKPRILRILLSVAVGVAVAAAIAYVQIRTAPTQTADGVIGVAGTPIGGNFEGLVDQNGQEVGPARFEDRYQLVFFGFTHCPAACPMALQAMTVVMDRLSPAQKARLAPIFVSVDPERDTPALLREYMASFDPGIVALTGTPDAVRKTVREWRVYAAKAQTPEMTEYTVDHSTYVYLRAPDGTLRDLFEHDTPPARMLESLRGALGS